MNDGSCVESYGCGKCLNCSTHPVCNFNNMFGFFRVRRGWHSISIVVVAELHQDGDDGRRCVGHSVKPFIYAHIFFFLQIFLIVDHIAYLFKNVLRALPVTWITVLVYMYRLYICLLCLFLDNNVVYSSRNIKK